MKFFDTYIYTPAKALFQIFPPPRKMNIAFAFLCVLALVVKGDEPENDSKAALASCGLSKVTYDGDKIVGGRDALEGELPWQISLQRKSGWSSSFSHICGGSVLNERYIITAAHCVDGGSPGEFQVVTGAHSLRTVAAKQQSHKVKRVVVHESYNSGTMENDIALLELASPFDLDGAEGYVNGACLPQQREETDGVVTASGWGATREGGSAASILQAVDVPVVSDATCRNQYGASAIYDSMICAGISAGGKDSCQGDSGGPLVKKENGKVTLVGVVSWGYGCARPGTSGVYTQVSYFVDWIKQNAVLFAN